MSSSQVLAYWKKDKFAPLRASLLIQGQISYFFIGQGGLVRFSDSIRDYKLNVDMIELVNVLSSKRDKVK